MKKSIRKIILSVCGVSLFLVAFANSDSDPCDCNNSKYGSLSYLKNEGCALPSWSWTGFKYKNGVRDCCRKAISPNPPGCYKSQEHPCIIPG